MYYASMSAGENPFKLVFEPPDAEEQEELREDRAQLILQASRLAEQSTHIPARQWEVVDAGWRTVYPQERRSPYSPDQEPVYKPRLAGEVVLRNDARTLHFLEDMWGNLELQRTKS